VAQLEVLFL
jgi:hypothetical protein